jgi:hypothetical protein
VLLGKARSVRGRIAAILAATAAIAAIGAGVPWLGAKFGLWNWPQSSARYGVLLGLVGGAIVLFEMALWPRKWFRSWRLGRTRLWLQFHVWLGLVCLPIILVHAGFSLGGPLAAVALILFLLVTASGIWGLVLQQWLPEQLIADAPNETIASQIEFVASLHVAEASRLIDDIPSDSKAYDALGTSAVAMEPASEVAVFRDTLLMPYLRGEARRRSPLRNRADASRRFEQLRDSLPESAAETIDRLEQLADLRRQWDVQKRINWWMHGWLTVHLPLAIAMTGLMLVHAVRALKYW